MMRQQRFVGDSQCKEMTGGMRDRLKKNLCRYHVNLMKPG